MYYELVSMYDLEEGEEITLEEAIERLKDDMYDYSDTFDYISRREEELDTINYKGNEYIITCEDEWQYRMYRIVSDAEIEADRKELEYERRELIRGLI